MKANLLCLCFVLFHLLLSAQIVVSDHFGNVIPFAQVFHKSTNFYAQSDLSGQVELTVFGPLSKSDSVYFSHISFKSRSISISELQKLDTVFLEIKRLEIPEFRLSARESKNQFQKVSGCFRSSQTNNDTIVYYMDGKSELFSKLNSNSYDIQLIENRSFERDTIKSTLKNHKVGIDFRLISIPYPDKKYIPSEFIKKHKLRIDSTGPNQFQIISPDGMLVGRVSIENNLLTYSIIDIYSIKTRSFLKTEVIWKHVEIVQVYRIQPENSDVVKSDFNDLIYVKHIRYADVKHEKDKDYISIKGEDEFFVESIELLESKPEVEFVRNLGFQKNSSFKTKFWENCHCELYELFQPKKIKNLSFLD